MSFDREALTALVAGNGPVARIVVAEVRGSAPRGAGTSMIVWPDGQAGTIGGGALEWEAVARARQALVLGEDRLDRLALGPALGQCCGGHVVLVTEIWDQVRLDEAGAEVVARPLPGTAAAPPLAVTRALGRMRAQGELPGAMMLDGWLIEPVARPERSIWIYGAGHVGRAIAGVLAPLPQLCVTLVDNRAEAMPDPVPEGISALVAANPADAVALAPNHAEHLILTYSHALDLELCHRVLGRAFRSAGLIGSATKRARFRNRLSALGHGAERIARLQCPIGDPALGKHPQAIALGVATELIRAGACGADTENRQRDAG